MPDTETVSLSGDGEVIEAETGEMFSAAAEIPLVEDKK